MGNVGLKYKVSTRSDTPVVTSIITDLPIFANYELQTIVIQFDLR